MYSLSDGSTQIPAGHNLSLILLHRYWNPTLHEFRAIPDTGIFAFVYSAFSVKTFWCSPLNNSMSQSPLVWCHCGELVVCDDCISHLFWALLHATHCLTSANIASVGLSPGRWQAGQRRGRFFLKIINVLVFRVRLLQFCKFIQFGFKQICWKKALSVGQPIVHQRLGWISSWSSAVRCSLAGTVAELEGTIWTSCRLATSCSACLSMCRGNRKLRKALGTLGTVGILGTLGTHVASPPECTIISIRPFAGGTWTSLLASPDHSTV